MIKVSVLYPNKSGARFDHAYYRDSHLPTCKSLLGDACLHYAIDKGLPGPAPGGAPTYVAACHFFFESLESCQAALAAGGRKMAADVPNYTDIEPVMAFFEVVVEHS